MSLIHLNFILKVIPLNLEIKVLLMRNVVLSVFRLPLVIKDDLKNDQENLKKQ